MTKAVNKRVAVFNKFNERCAYCGCKITIDEFHVDHIISRSGVKSGREFLPYGSSLNDISNLNPSCGSCNAMKHDFSLEDFRSFVKNGLRRMAANEAKLKIGIRLGVISLKDKDIVFYFEKIKPLL